jgi:predicted amidohydrolase YtcJ
MLRKLVPIAVLGLLAFVWLRPETPGRVLYKGGPVVTLDEDGSVAEALATDGDRIVAVGSEAELSEWAEQTGARVVDLEGRALLPGFIDAHGHFPGEGLYSLHADLNSPPVGQIEDIEDLVDSLASHAAEIDDGKWVLGISYDDTLLAEGRHPTREELDRASSEHPIVAWHISLHFAVVNSRALEVLGVAENAADPAGGRFGRDPNSGRLNGLLEENATNLVRDVLSQPSLFDGIAVLREANRRSLEAGVTTVQCGYCEPAQMRALPWASRLGLFDLRLIVWPSERAQDEALDSGRSFAGTGNDWIRYGAVKLMADGSIQGYTGYLSEPYHSAPKDDANYRGYARMERAELLARVRRYHEAGLQIAVHGNGDASIDDILDAFEAAQEAAPRDDARHIVIHAQTARPDQLRRMAELDVRPSFFVLHTYYWGDRHRRIFLGPERARSISPLAGADEAGVRYTIHADSPVVPLEPLRLVWSAVNRRTRSGYVLGEEERIDVVRALRATTIDAAHQHFEDHLKGSLEPGKLADMVILSRSPLESPDALDEIRVEETIIGGRSAFRRL